MTATQQRTARQQPVHARESTALRLGPAAPWQPTIDPAYRAAPKSGQETTPRQRTPLAVVPAPIRRTGRGFVALCVGILVVALLAVLVVNISVSNRQYDMVGLKNEQLDLTQTNERLRQQVEHLEAPQNLAAEAKRLGMVRPGDIAAIDLSTGRVTGAATSAGEEDRPGGLVAAPSGPDAQAEAPAGEPGPQASVAPGAAAAAPSGAPDETGAQDETGTDAGRADVGQGAPTATEARSGEDDENGATGENSATEQDLNGGTIPAPQFSGGSAG